MRLIFFLICFAGICLKGSSQLLPQAQLDSSNQYYTMTSAREHKNEVYWFEYQDWSTKDSLTDEISIFPNLNRLVIGNNHYKSIPSSISKLQYLQELMIYECPDLNMPEVFKILKDLKYLRYLDVSRFNYYAFEGTNKINLTGISQLKELDYLSCMYDHLDSFPTELYQLKKLKILLLNSTGLTYLPEDIGKLSSVEILYLGAAKEGEGNAVKVLPESFAQLTNLKYLDLSGNPLEIESTISILKKLPKLESLDLSMIPIESLPASISELKSLKNLDLSNCGIKQFPESISLLKQLETITCYYNSIDESTKTKLNVWLPNTKIYY